MLTVFGYFKSTFKKIHCLTREFRVKLHAKTDIARIVISAFARNLTQNSRVR